MILLKIGAITADLRRKSGFTQAEAADKLGVSRTMLSQYENGICEIPISVFIKMAELYDFDIYDAFGIKNPKYGDYGKESFEIIANEHKKRLDRYGMERKDLKVVIAIDSFKGSMTSLEAGSAVADGIRKAVEDVRIDVCPAADGGEGTVKTLADGLGGNIIKESVCGPYGRKVMAQYCVTPMGVCVIEAASAAGLSLTRENERDPMRATTRGLGELILKAVKSGCRQFIIGIGGTAANDGGTGMLSALGYKFSDSCGNEIADGAAGLRDLASIECDGVAPELSECSFSIACDVTNPLCGENGCSAVYAPQKGAKSEDIPLMDEWLENYAELTEKINPEADKDYPGAGAAGGLGFAFISYLGAKLLPGAKLVMRTVGFERRIENADIIVTGEGRIDSQTVMGKLPAYVAEEANKRGIPVIAFAGSVDDKAAKGCGITAAFPVVRGVTDLSAAMDKENAKNNLENTAEQVFRLIKSVGL